MSNDVDLRGLSIDRGDGGQTILRTRQHVITRYILPLALILGFVSLVTWVSRDILFPPQPVTVVPVFSTTAAVRQEGTPLFQAAGWIEPRPTPVRVAGLAPGVIEKLLVVEDQVVKKGMPIAELIKDDAQLAHERVLADFKLRKAELEEAKADLKAAVTKLRQPVHLQAALREAEAALAKNKTQLANLPFATQRAEADEKAAQKDYDGKVASKGVITGVEIDIAKSKLDSAKALVAELHRREVSLKKEQAALTGRRDALKTQLDLRADEFKAKEGAEAREDAAAARVELARVVVAEAKLQLDRMTVRSPIDGRVFRLIAHPGARIGSGMTQMTGHDGSTVVTLYRPDWLQVRVDVRFEDIPKVTTIKQPVRIANAALSSPLRGEVLFVSSEADIQKNTLQVKVAVANPPAVLKPEMLVDVTFLAPKRADKDSEPAHELKLYVPQQLIHQEDGRSYVWMADQSDGVARKVFVKTGAAGIDGLIEVLSGLTTSSRIISSGIENLRDGDRIRVTGEDLSLGTNTTRPSGKRRTTNRLPKGAEK